MEPPKPKRRAPTAKEKEARARKVNARRRERRRILRLLETERAYIERGFTRIAGVDEAGMGPLAGPVVAAAVILPDGMPILGTNDSKRLTATARVGLDREIREKAVALGVGVVDPEEIDRWNIYQAGLLAMRRALDGCDPPPGLVLLDARTLPNLPWPQEARIKADTSIHCVSCASIVAKVYRDALMLEYDRVYPEYGFASHKGYATAAHRDAVRRHGPCPIHRRSFLAPDLQLPLFEDPGL